MNRAGGGTYTGTRPSVQSLMIGRLLLPRPSQVLDDVIDARGERGHVRRLHRGEHADAQLVAPELAVSGRVYDAVLAQRGDDLFGADRVIQVDGDDRIGARARVGDERPAYSLRSAHSYSSAADCAQRAVDQAMPPFSLSQRTWFSSMISVATDGVFRV